MLWKDRIEAQRQIVIGAGMVMVYGVSQKEGDVLHVIVHRLEDLTRRPGLISGDGERSVSVNNVGFRETVPPACMSDMKAKADAAPVKQSTVIVMPAR
ncbi:hypothetical protein J2D73_15995 [Acetobacter sacchari]|uniref:Uncharacterized protein n=1 Tax=Acetobacter sacchari TaxID=2661687 RepID=A0ABS3LZE8_9PROT|nr:hypothetical protein [Acetobacter sacchari]MBO1361289.1 hypothetical protein [Acetobacter sacchari]